MSGLSNNLSKSRLLFIALEIILFVIISSFLFVNLGVIIVIALFAGAVVWWATPYVHRMISNRADTAIAEKFVSRRINFTYQTKSEKQVMINLLVTRIWASRDGDLMVSGYYNQRDINLRFRAERMFDVEDIEHKQKYENGSLWASIIIGRNTA